jgi:hypothetical protein
MFAQLSDFDPNPLLLGHPVLLSPYIHEIAEKNSTINILKETVLSVPVKTKTNCKRMRMLIDLSMSFRIYQTISFIMDSHD